MKIRGPSGHNTITPGDESIASKGKAGGTGFDKLLGPDEAGVSAKADAPDGVQRNEALREIVADIRAGRISRTEGAEKLIQLSVETRAAALPKRQQAELTKALRRFLDEDPWLAQQLARVGSSAAE